jgi:hypothetical protein
MDTPKGSLYAPCFPRLTLYDAVITSVLPRTFSTTAS